MILNPAVSGAVNIFPPLPFRLRQFRCMKKIAIFWHRRDLRLEDNAGLHQALRSGYPVLPLFIFDTAILDALQDKADPRVAFIHEQVMAMKAALEEQGSTLLLRHGLPLSVWQQILREFEVAAVFANRDYEPYANRRDEAVAALLRSHGVEWHTCKDHVLFEHGEVLKNDATPYTVFTPYRRKWRERLRSRCEDEDDGSSFYLQSYPSEQYSDTFLRRAPAPVLSLEDMGFRRSTLAIPPRTVAQGLIRRYDQTRDLPAVRGTSRLGIHFRFGTISIREKARRAMPLNDTFVNELIWRDFYAQILAAYPHVATRAFRPEYEYIEWRDDTAAFERWCNGQTGYPIVDAGMRELNQSGWMHNRVRMITASFLTKHLLIDWRWGEAYFAEKLLDFDLASNNGGWQWAAGSGTDAAPYFRIFNPYTQQRKFDPQLEYVRRWVPEYGSSRYPAPIVDHKAARARCLEVYRAGIARGKQAFGSGAR